MADSGCGENPRYQLAANLPRFIAWTMRQIARINRRVNRRNKATGRTLIERVENVLKFIVNPADGVKIASVGAIEIVRR